MKIKFILLGSCLALSLCIESAFAQKIFIDPDTSEVTTPSAEEEEELQELQELQQTEEEYSMNYSEEGLEIVTHPDGSESIDLKGRFQSYQYGTIDNSTGKLTVDHQQPKPTESHQTSIKAIDKK